MISFDVISLFTSVPIDKAIDYILKKVYNEKKIQTNIAKTVLTLFGLGWDIFIPPISLFMISQEILMVST